MTAAGATAMLEQPVSNTTPKATYLNRGSLTELAQRLETMQASTRDIVASTTDVRLSGGTQLVVPKIGGLPLTRHAETQLAEKTGIPQRYFDRMRASAPTLLDDNVNTWLGQTPERRLFRAADGHIRAILSDRYRMLDNYDLAMKIAQSAMAHHASIESASLTETRMQIRVIVPGAREKIGELTSAIRQAHAGVHQVRGGSVMDLDADYMVPGVFVSNSEVGAGAFQVEPYALRLVCWNGMISEAKLYKVHVGSRLIDGEQFYSDRTRQLDDQALWAKVQDVIDATFNPDTFRAMIAQFREAKEVVIEQPVEVTEAVSVKLGFTEAQKNSLLRYFTIEGHNVFGMVNGITQIAGDLADPDAQADLERAAGKFLAAPESVLALA